MAINYTNLLGLAKPVTGTEANTWGDVVNDQITELVEEAIAGSVSLNVTAGNVTLTDTQGTANQARAAALIISGSPGVSRNIIAPSRDKTYFVVNGSDSAVVIKGSATTGATVTSGTRAVVTWNGTDFVVIAGSVTSLTSQVTGILPVANGGTGASSITSGAIVLGNGSSAVNTLVGSSVGQIPQWSGTAWTVGTLPSTGVSSVSASAPLASSGGATPNISFTGTLPEASGGTGETSYSSGELLIGNSVGGLSRATLTAGANISIINGSGSITISSTGSTGITSFSINGGTTGLGFSPGTISSSGATTTMSGTLATNNGGTGVAAASLDAAGIVTKADNQTITGEKLFSASSAGVAIGRPVTDGVGRWGSPSQRWFSVVAQNFNVADNSSFSGDAAGTFVTLGTEYAARFIVTSAIVGPNGDNNISLGSAGGRWSVVYAATGTINTSDLRQKTEIQPTDLGLDFIKKLEPVSYKWKVGGTTMTAILDENPDTSPAFGASLDRPVNITSVPGKRKHYGLIAQQVKEALQGKDFGGFVHDPDKDHYGLRYDQFIAPLIKAVQELSQEVNALKARIEALESQ
jgi:hypothetical protein